MPPATEHPPAGPWRWNACEYPERPPEGGTVYWPGCRACALALIAAVETGAVPTDHLRYHEAEGVWSYPTVAEAVALMRARLEADHA